MIMDFRKFAGALPAMNDLQSGNESMALTNLPPNLLEALIPGYGPISRYIQVAFGFDISIVVSIGLIAVAVAKGGEYLFEQAERLFRRVFMSSVYIDEHDDLFDMVMAWLAEHQGSAARRSVRAKTQRGSSTDETMDASTRDALDENGMFDYNKWSARTPPRYEPYYGRHMLWHKGRLFFFRRAQRPSQGTRVQVSWGNAPEDDVLQLDCIGRSTGPIRELLRTIKTWSLDRLRGSTTIRHPTPKDRARWGGSWSKTTSRPSRPMETVILDADQKYGIVKDMNEYLHPASPKWYATRGIPYRRGYLFHGPPGTGKTSLSFALAGIFGLEIYAISLQEPTLTEGDLMMLFNGLPRRCVVLLEDVDAAGLLRDEQSDKSGDGGKRGRKKETKEGEKNSSNKDSEKKTEKEQDQKKDEDYTLKDLARELKAIGGGGGKGGGQGKRDGLGGHPNRAPGTGISLSGLLNAIDGVATHEGRVLIMTTNHPEKLDAALVRPGRVDRRVEFRLAMKAQVRELFVRMYAAGDQIHHVESQTPSNKKQNGFANGSVASNGHANGHLPGKSQLSSLSEAALEELAVEFASHIPDNTFTPAEIQNLLMQHKMEPWTALEKAEGWVKQTLEEKEQQRLAKLTAEEGDED